MKNINIVVAFAANNRVIGNSVTNNLPGWKLGSDMKNFRELTMGHIVIMGRKTFESFPQKYRPLPGRINIIISRDKNYQPQPSNADTYVCESLEKALLKAEELSEEKKIFIIGGGQIYEQVIGNPLIHVDTIYATEVKGEFEGDVFFPELNVLDYRETHIAPYDQDEKNSHAFAIKIYRHLPSII